MQKVQLVCIPSWLHASVRAGAMAGDKTKSLLEGEKDILAAGRFANSWTDRKEEERIRATSPAKGTIRD